MSAEDRAALEDLQLDRHRAQRVTADTMWRPNSGNPLEDIQRWLETDQARQRLLNQQARRRQLERGVYNLRRHQDEAARRAWRAAHGAAITFTDPVTPSGRARRIMEERACSEHAARLLLHADRADQIGPA